MSNNVRTTIISVAAFATFIAVMIVILHLSAQADAGAAQRMSECVSAGGTFVDTSPELCLIGTETR